MCACGPEEAWIDSVCERCGDDETGCSDIPAHGDTPAYRHLCGECFLTAVHAYYESIEGKAAFAGRRRPGRRRHRARRAAS
jgi:hypothetical protein